MVGRLRLRGCPTPAWLFSGVTEQGVSYGVQELVDGDAGTWSSVPLPAVLASIELQAGLGEPATETWSTYIEWVLSSDDGPWAFCRPWAVRGRAWSTTFGASWLPRIGNGNPLLGRLPSATDGVRQ